MRNPMPRHLLIKTCVAKGDEISVPTIVVPVVHAALYNIPEVREAREYIETHPACEGMWLRLGQRAYSLTILVSDEAPPHSFEINDG
jgi:3-dehydroquinate dehydratase